MELLVQIPSLLGKPPKVHSHLGTRTSVHHQHELVHVTVEEQKQYEYV